MTMYAQIQVADSTGLNYVDDKGDIYTSQIIRRLISSEDNFEYIGTAEDLELYGLGKDQISGFKEKLQSKRIEQQGISSKKGKNTVSLNEIEQLLFYINNIQSDPYFYWKTDIILAKIQEEEILEL